MKRMPANLSAGQVRAYEVIQRIRMAWVALICVLALFSLGFLAFLWAAFNLEGAEVTKGVLGGVDLLLGWNMKKVFDNLFPAVDAGRSAEAEAVGNAGRRG